jgi:prophage regulatory protein
MKTVSAIRFLRLPEVKQITGLKKTAIYERINEGTFPTPINLGGRAVGWIEEEVTKWAEDRVAKSRPTLCRPVQAAA